MNKVRAEGPRLRAEGLGLRAEGGGVIVTLPPITVGRVTITPPPSALSPKPSALSRGPSALTLFIQPSMGFGTGHHATTRLCLAAMQAIDLADKTVLDVGTGSGVLAIAAARLGAASALGIDVDPDALQSARENLPHNPLARNVRFELADFRTRTLPPADVVVANLTGALLAQSAAALVSAANSGGTLIVSGLMTAERDAVRRAIALPVAWERTEDEWVAVAMKKR